MNGNRREFLLLVENFKLFRSPLRKTNRKFSSKSYQWLALSFLVLIRTLQSKRLRLICVSFGGSPKIAAVTGLRCLNHYIHFAGFERKTQKQTIIIFQEKLFFEKFLFHSTKFSAVVHTSERAGEHTSVVCFSRRLLSPARIDKNPSSSSHVSYLKSRVSKKVSSWSCVFLSYDRRTRINF